MDSTQKPTQTTLERLKQVVAMLLLRYLATVVPVL
jgi:hypothetical protein